MDALSLSGLNSLLLYSISYNFTVKEAGLRRIASHTHVHKHHFCDRYSGTQIRIGKYNMYLFFLLVPPARKNPLSKCVRKNPLLKCVIGLAFFPLMVRCAFFALVEKNGTLKKVFLKLWETIVNANFQTLLCWSDLHVQTLRLV